jgi:hypothetical protein
LLVIKISNSGNIPITNTDYERPLGFDFKSKILEAEVIKTVPDDLKIKLDIAYDQILIEPKLLNEDDSLWIKVILSEFTGTIKPDVRIFGIKAIQDKTNKGKNSLFSMLLGILLGTVIGLSVVLFTFYMLLKFRIVKIDLTKNGQ